MRVADNSGQGWFLSYLRQYCWAFLAAALLGALAIGCAGALLFTSGHLITRSALKPENILMVYVPIVLVRTFGFSKAVIQYLERLVGHDAALRLVSRMRVRLYRAVEPQALMIRSKFRTGDLLGLLAEDIDQLQNIYLKLVLPALSALLIYAAGISALGWMDGTFALLMALYCAYLLLIAPAISLWTSLAKRRTFKQERSKAYQELTDALFGMSDLVLSGRTEHFLTSFAGRQNKAAMVENSLRRGEWRSHWIAQCVVGGGIVIMTVWAGGLVAQNHLEATWLASFALAAFPLLDAFVRAGEAVVHAPEYQDSLRRLKDTEKNTHTPAVDKGQRATDITAEATGTHAAVHQAGSAGELLLDNVSYRYSEKQAWSVRNISMRVPQGGKVALLGRSGAGKSTLLNLIQGALQPDEGNVTVEGTPVYTGGAYSSLFAVLNQQPYLFDTTVANNIRLGRPDASLEEVRAVTEQVGLGALIDSLPEGYDTRMQETGLRFSGGERQRIALARILLQNHPIVLLDEPTVGLDPLTEHELMQTMFRVLEGKTLIWITHHLTGMEHMDEVIFMEQGGISMRGSHEQLWQEQPRYRNLYELDHPRL
ncbi:thiol reductant ABC exporter subunit CydC [Paenibacillus kribbensis]|uniref:thiol reductant ABC exporter subunit CydC n=1 Tax=Paenibacillus kribbensis TaxID=172713 RepID=UPI002DB6C0B6|nr:thiol reductant ABC exporter subunit CydC [Paenibacillus kribbensis]MEC0235499.1 thiol reductant ABC exporter subunit CydC [Paenibacillus kribbensis]